MRGLVHAISSVVLLALLAACIHVAPSPTGSPQPRPGELAPSAAGPTAPAEQPAAVHPTTEADQPSATVTLPSAAPAHPSATPERASSLPAPTSRPTSIPIPTATPLPPLEVPQTLTISYAGADEWLRDVASEDQDDQIRDWMVLGLASALKLDVTTLRDALYDQTPVRDPLFFDMATNRVGPGRGLPDNRGTLHVLAPADDPYLARTIGMVLDDYRKDSGADPDQVQLYWYRIDRQAQQVTLEAQPLLPAQAARERYGYREMAIDGMPTLERFLSETQHLARLELRGNQLWAGGWNWPNIPTGSLTPEDLTALLRGYRAASTGQLDPGFSLDPGEPLDLDALLPMLPATSALVQQADEIRSFIADWRAASTDQKNEVLQRHADLVNNEQLYDRAIGLAEHFPAYQHARYDGGLQGTEAGMTYFYTDIVAKAWTLETGSGVPTGQVPGFLSNVQAKTPWGHCDANQQEQGRLWFGLREDAITVRDQQVDLGSITTRIFTLIQDPQGNDQEIEPSYTFGRGIWWWDRHYLAMADYEPQYHRLDQLMRWGAAIAWLVAQGQDKLLPEVSEDQIRQDWRFGDWLAAHPQLKWQFDIPFIAPPNEKTEALLMLYSAASEDCGMLRYWSGGISNPSISRIRELQQRRPHLDPAVARGGQTTDSTNLVGRSGTVATVDGTKRTFDPIVGDTASVKVEAKGRKVWPLGPIKILRDEQQSRQISLVLSADTDHFSQRVSVQRFDVGEVSATPGDSAIIISFKPGPIERARRVLQTIQKLLPDHSLPDAIANSEGGFVWSASSDQSQVVVKIDNPPATKPWMHIAPTRGPPSSDQDITLRLGIPGQPGQEPLFLDAIFVDASPPSLPDGTRPGWLEIHPGDNVRSAEIEATQRPNSEAQALVFRNIQDNTSGTLWLDNGRYLTADDDAIFAMNGTADAFGLRNLAILQHLVESRVDAKSSNGRLYRAIPVADQGIVLVGSQEFLIVQPGHKQYRQIQANIEQPAGQQEWLYKVEGQNILSVEKIESQELAFATVSSNLLTANIVSNLRRSDPAVSRSSRVFVDSSAVSLIFDEARTPAEVIGTGLQIRVVEVPQLPASLNPNRAPDILVMGQTEFRSLESLKSSQAQQPGTAAPQLGSQGPGGQQPGGQPSSGGAPSAVPPRPGEPQYATAVQALPGNASTPTAEPGAAVPNVVPPAIILIYLADNCDTYQGYLRCQ
jgi:hypothetical protein